MKRDPTHPIGRPLVEDRKDAVLSVRMTDAEYATILAYADAAREDLSDYVRHRLLSVYINSILPPAMAD